MKNRMTFFAIVLFSSSFSLTIQMANASRVGFTEVHGRIEGFDDKNVQFTSANKKLIVPKSAFKGLDLQIGSQVTISVSESEFQAIKIKTKNH